MVRFFRSLLNSKFDMLDPDNPEEAAAATSRECPRDRAHGGGDCHSDEGNDKRESRGPDGLPVELLKLGLQQDRTILLEFRRLTTLI